MCMKIKFPLVILLLASSLAAISQEEEIRNQKKNGKPEYKWAASFSLGIVPVPQNPLSLQPGIYFTPRFSLFNEISIQTGKHNHADSAAMNKKYFKYKAELRYYLPAGMRTNPFFALQFITAKRNFDRGKPGKFYETGERDSVFTFNKASVNSPYQALSLNFGVTKSLAEKFYLDCSFGYGFRFVNTTYSNIENLQKEKEYRWFSVRPFSSYKYNGRRTGSQLNFALRLFYTF
jgi:hypothetical protein